MRYRDVDEITINRCDNGYTIDVWYKDQDDRDDEGGNNPFSNRPKRLFVTMDKSGIFDILSDVLHNN